MAEIVAIDDQPEVLELLEQLLGPEHRLHPFRHGEAALDFLARQGRPADLVILDLDLGPGHRPGLEILELLRQRHPELIVVILTGKGSIDEAVRAMRLGAADFIEKDPRLAQRLQLQLAKVERLRRVADDNRRLRRRCAWLEERSGPLPEMIGSDAGLAGVWRQIQDLADIPRPVLILGERGTGKELVAAALHRAGNRREGPFITVNCAAINESLAEAELFGHEKGAFTDAAGRRPGKFELADGGTLFLDEVGNMPVSIQKKLLRVIEYQSFSRLRGSREIKVDVRVTAATNADLPAEIAAGRFRSDLYDRLTFDTIVVPPLRERRQDIPALCRHFITGFRREVAGVRCRDISPAALALLAGQPFPGNVRELKNLIERAAYRCRGEVIDVADLDLRPGGAEAGEAGGGGLRRRVAEFERRLLRQALAASGGNLRQAARDLELSYDQLRRLVKKYQLGAGRSGDN